MSADSRTMPPPHGTTHVERTSASKTKAGNGLGLRSPHAIVGSLCVVAIAFGLVSPVDLDLAASAGLGYALGIVGLGAMIGLLGYSLRKRMKLLRDAGPIRRWFEIHLMLGLIGPTAILYHSDFQLGSLNSTISLMCVLVVSGSGVGGRFLYGRLHRSLAGPRRTTEAYNRDAAYQLKRIEGVLAKTPRAEAQVQAFVSLVQEDCSPLVLPIRYVALRPHAWRTRRAVMREIAARAHPRVPPRELRTVVETAFTDLCRGFELRVFEKLFALWHAIHVPLTVLLFVSAAVHVLAVHLF